MILKSSIENKKEWNYIKNHKNQIIWRFVNHVFSAKAKNKLWVSTSCSPNIENKIEKTHGKF